MFSDDEYIVRINVKDGEIKKHCFCIICCKCKKRTSQRGSTTTNKGSRLLRGSSFTICIDELLNEINKNDTFRHVLPKNVQNSLNSFVDNPVGNYINKFSKSDSIKGGHNDSIDDSAKRGFEFILNEKSGTFAGVKGVQFPSAFQQVTTSNDNISNSNEDVKHSKGISIRGYDGLSMSNRAREAYSEGRKPLSKFNKEDLEYFNDMLEGMGIENKVKTVAGLKRLVEEYGNTGEWHHTSQK